MAKILRLIRVGYMKPSGITDGYGAAVKDVEKEFRIEGVPYIVGFPSENGGDSIAIFDLVEES